MRTIVFLLVVALTLVSSQRRTRRIDVILEYTGNVNWQANTAELGSQSESIRTSLSSDGQIHYEVLSRLRGAVSRINAVLVWIEQGKSYNATLDISFGGSHVNQPHILHAKTLQPAIVLPSHHEVLASIGVYNITSGEGAFNDVTGGITVNGYHAVSGEATWIINAIFWAPAFDEFKI